MRTESHTQSLCVYFLPLTLTENRHSCAEIWKLIRFYTFLSLWVLTLPAWNRQISWEAVSWTGVRLLLAPGYFTHLEALLKADQLTGFKNSKAPERQRAALFTFTLDENVFVLFSAIAESPWEYEENQPWRTAKNTHNNKDICMPRHMLKYSGNLKMRMTVFTLFKKIYIIPTSRWFTVTNKELPVLPALIGLGGVQLSESTTLTGRTGCWLSLSEHAQMQRREQVQIHFVGFW